MTASIDSEKTICVSCFRFHWSGVDAVSLFHAGCCIHHAVIVAETGEPKFLCTKWRENNAKDRIIHACEPDYIVRSEGDRE